jgi:hypothetical protein
MTRKDYKLAAKQIVEGNFTDYDRHLVAYFCCELFKTDDEAFNKDLFLDAAGVDGDAINWHLDIKGDE